MDGPVKGWVQANVKPWYERNIYPNLTSSQKALVVPGTLLLVRPNFAPLEEAIESHYVACVISVVAEFMVRCCI
jgi:hypothetical protein